MRLFSPRRGLGMLKTILLVTALMLLGAGGFFAVTRLRPADGRAELQATANQPQGDESAARAETLSLGEFLVNLRSSDGALRYLQAEISIVVAAPDDEEGGGEGDGQGTALAEEGPRLPSASHRYARDVAIEVLSSQSFERLREQTDRARLKATLQQRLDAALEGYEVQDVLFTAFVMQ